MNGQIQESWRGRLREEFGKTYFRNLTDFVRSEYHTNVVYPPSKDIFKAFDLTPFEEVRVVILGQDPYHGAEQAHGLGFSVPEGVKAPPSLQNIFKEVESDLGHEVSRGTNLTRWATQGVLLLNATLTVRAGSAGSHQGKGWEEFTDAAIRKLDNEKRHLVFILWGNHARRKGSFIDRGRHLVLESPHPSPFSAQSGFFGSRPFTKTNEYLKAHGEKEIVW